MATAYDEEDDIMLPLFEEPSSPVRPKLKRLKKASDRQPKVHLPDLPPVNQTLPPDSLEQELDPLFPDSKGLIHELRKEKLDQVIEDEPLLPDSVEEESIVEDNDSIDPLFPDSGGLMEELRKERMEEIKVGDPNLTNMEDDSLDPDKEELNDGLDPLFPKPGENKGWGGEKIGEGGVIEQPRKEKTVKKCLVFNTEDESLEKEAKQMEDKFQDPEDELNDGLDPLFPKVGEYKAWEGEEIGEGGLIEELRQEKSAKKCLNFDKEDESSEKETKRKKRKSRDKTDDKPKEAVRDKRRSEKERRVQLSSIHAESQRLLRETSDASFKPLPVVHKPISSVLEKIRLRKLEILKKSSASFQISENGSSVGAGSQFVDASDTPNVTKDNEILDVDASADQAVHVRSSECALEGEKASKSSDNRKNGSEKQKPKPDISESASKDEDESDNGRPSNEEHNQSENDITDNEMDEVPALSTAGTNPAVPSDDVLSSSSDDDEEGEENYNDKENIDPHSRDLSTTDKYKSRSAFLKDFVDVEAEEEDDSDHDMARFPENEEDIDEEESDENEELKDLIATGYKEGEVDQERRNELHLKWLQQQDMTETDNVLQKLKYSNLQKEDLMDEVEEESEDEDEDGDEDEGEGSGDDAMSDSGAGTDGLKNILRQNSEKVKQMMMFNDDHDVYVSSDEDENEDHMLRRRISKQLDTEIASLLENEESREVFGLIKKLNIAPPPKRRGNHAANLDMLNVGRNNNSFSKFFGRKASGSMTSSHKTVIGRSFIFGRDDSNSRSGLQSDQSSENPDQSDMDPKENNQKRKHIATNLTSSQLKLATAENSGSSSGSSLFEILRRSSISSDEQIEDKSQLTETQATHIYSTFKVGRGFSKVDTRF